MTDKPQSLTDTVKAAARQTIEDWYGVSSMRVAHHAFKDGLMTRAEAWQVFTKLMGKGEAASRREWMERSGGDVEVGMQVLREKRSH